MGAVSDYNAEFPIRTLRLVETFQSKNVDYTLNVTLLMNCLLGLIVVAVENSDRRQLITGNLDDEFLDLLPDTIELKVGNQELKEHPKSVLKTRGKLSTLRKIRNSIAHQHVQPHNHGDNWIGVTLWNLTPQNTIDFRLELSTAQLKALATYIAHQYLQTNS